VAGAVASSKAAVTAATAPRDQETLQSAAVAELEWQLLLLLQWQLLLLPLFLLK